MGLAFGLGVKTSVGIPASVTELPGFESPLYFHLQLPTNMISEMQHTMAQVAKGLPSPGEAWIQIQDHGFSLTSPIFCRHLGYKSESSLFLPICL